MSMAGTAGGLRRGAAAVPVALPGFGRWTKKEALSRRANQGENGCMLILQRINRE